MIREEFVTRDTAKLLRTCGYPGIDMALTPLNAVAKANEDASLFNDKVWREAGLPTQAQAMRWLRETHKIAIEPTTDEGISDWQVAILDWSEEIRVSLILPSQYGLPAYEAAVEEGIRSACQYLIENKQQ